jgi:hypothetical protein
VTCPTCGEVALNVEERSDGVTFYKHTAGVYHLTGVPMRDVGFGPDPAF